MGRRANTVDGSPERGGNLLDKSSSHKRQRMALWLGTMVGVFVVLVCIAWIFKCQRRQRNLPSIGDHTVESDGLSPQGLNTVEGDDREPPHGVDLDALGERLPSIRPFVIGTLYLEKPMVIGEHNGNMNLDSRNDQALPCAICLDLLTVGDEARSLPCGHLFHRLCIDPWLHKKKLCPSCRGVVDTVPNQATADTVSLCSALASNDTAHADLMPPAEGGGLDTPAAPTGRSSDILDLRFGIVRI